MLLATNAPGQYSVAWTSVGADDGHTQRGSFTFSVVAPSAPGSKSGSSSPGSASLTAFRTLEYVALLIAAGMLLVARLARRDPPIAWIRLRSYLPWVLAVALLAAVIVVSSEVSAAAGSVGEAWAYLTTGVPGIARVILLASLALALLAAVLPIPVWPFLVSTLVALAASGHAASVRPAWWGITANAVHLLAAALWVGGMMTLAVLRPPGGFQGPQWPQLVDRFTPVAITAFLTTALFGTLQAIQDVGTLHGLFSTRYGVVLVAKIAGVAAMVPLSLMAWRRRLAPRAEALVALLVIGAASLLAAYPLPALQLAGARAGAAPTPGASGRAVPVTRPGELTLGGHVGPVLLGITLDPGTPGENRLTVYVLPLEGSGAAVPIGLSVDGKRVTVNGCGATCRRAEVALGGGERVTVGVGAFTSPLGRFAGGSTVFDIPDLPAPDGAALLDKAQRVMHALRTFRLDETLNSGLATVVSTYSFEAPDRLQIKTGDTQSVLIGGTRYLKQGANAPWQVQSGGPSVPVPSFIWDSFKPYIDPRVIGTARVGDLRATIVAFAGTITGSRIWFRLWVDARGYVLQAQMRAVGHFMDHTYFDFDSPISITAPAG